MKVDHLHITAMGQTEYFVYIQHYAGQAHILHSTEFSFRVLAWHLPIHVDVENHNKLWHANEWYISNNKILHGDPRGHIPQFMALKIIFTLSSID